MRLMFFAGVLTLAVFSMSAAMADAAKQPDDHAPIGLSGDHLHRTGEWMVGYKYEVTQTSGYRKGRHRVSNNSVLTAYGEAAIGMEMGMHMVEVMYGVTDDLTLMLMPQFMQMEMTHQSLHGGGHMHTHEVEGWGDTELVGLYSLTRAPAARAHLTLGASLPTGSIDKTFADHHNTVYHLPYNMQFGSGTVDPIIGATYTRDMTDWSWGAQTTNTIRLGKNANGYRQGNRYGVTAWAAKNISRFASISLRAEGEAWGNVTGRDASLPLTTIAGANPKKQEGERVMAYVGLNLLAGEGMLDGHRLAGEFGLPLYERATGPQPDTDYRFTLGWQYAW